MMKYCSGSHKCYICDNKYDCDGTDYGHSGVKEYKCMGGYVQFCPNHTIKEYIKAHKERGEL